MILSIYVKKLLIMRALKVEHPKRKITNEAMSLFENRIANNHSSPLKHCVTLFVKYYFVI
jgi:hypothetical protein